MPSTDPSLALQDAFLVALKGQTGAGANVFDAVPPANPFPRITIGSGQTVPNSADCYDGSESFLDVDVWSNRTGYPEVKGIADEVRTILDNNTSLPLNGHHLDLLSIQSSTVERDPDGLTSRARMLFRALTQPDP